MTSLDNFVTQSQNPIEQQTKIKLYNPNNYLFIGFFLSLIPVFIMSLSNSRLLRNGEQVRSGVIKVLWGFVLVVMAYYGAIIWGVFEGVDAILKDRPSHELAKIIMQNGGFIFGALNLLILVLLLTHINKTEAPAYKELFEARQVEKRSMVFPVVVGLLFAIFNYYLVSQVVDYVLKESIKSAITQTISERGVSKSLITKMDTANSKLATDKQVESVLPEDLCTLLSVQKAAEITGLPINDVEYYSDRCFYKDDVRNRFLLIKEDRDYEETKLELASSFGDLNYILHSEVSEGAFYFESDYNHYVYFKVGSTNYSLGGGSRHSDFTEAILVNLAKEVVKNAENKQKVPHLK